MQRSDVADAIAHNEIFDFLVDILPREECSPASGISVARGGTVPEQQDVEDDEPASSAAGAGRKRKRPDELEEDEEEEEEEEDI